MSQLPPDVRRDIFATFAEMRPDLWTKCYPRIYDEAAHGQYASPKEVATDMLSAATKIEQGYHGQNERMEILWASKLARFRVPIFWLTRDIATALMHTTPPQTLDLQTMKMPFDAACFMLPLTVKSKDGKVITPAPLRHRTEGDVLFVSYLRTHLYEEIRSLATTNPQVWHQLGNGVVTVFAHTAADMLMHWTIPDNIAVNIGELNTLMQRFEQQWEDHTSEFKSAYFDESMTEDDNILMARVCHLVLGTLVLMTARPDLVTHGELRKRVMKAHELPKEFWSPNIIGANYKLRHERVDQGGTHASPRVHWVRGFYRQQPIGPREEHQHKEIWVEPFMRGGE